jgi:hypothetical protein
MQKGHDNSKRLEPDNSKKRARVSEQAIDAYDH